MNDMPNRLGGELSAEQLAYYEGYPKKSEVIKTLDIDPTNEEALMLMDLFIRKEAAVSALKQLEVERGLDDFMNDTTADSSRLLLQVGENTARIWFHGKSPELISEMYEILSRELDLCNDDSSYAESDVMYDGVYYDFNSPQLIRLRSLFRLTGVIHAKDAKFYYTDLSKTYTLKKNLGKLIEGMVNHLSTLIK